MIMIIIIIVVYTNIIVDILIVINNIRVRWTNVSYKRWCLW